MLLIKLEGGVERRDGQDEVDFAISQSEQCPNFLDFVLGRHWVKRMEKSKRIFMMAIKTTPTQLKDRLIL